MYKSFAETVAINIDWDTARRNHITWLECQVIRLSNEYKTMKARGYDETAAELRLAGIAMKARLDMAVAREGR